MKRRAFLGHALCATALLSSAGCATLRPGAARTPASGLRPVPALPANGVIGVIAPAGPAPGRAAEVSTLLMSRGYQPVVFPGTEQDTGYLAGADAVRLQDLHDAFSDRRIDAIICLRGGYGSARLLDRIDFGMIRANPKPLVGYSDITALHLAIARHAGLITFHGPMLSSDLLVPKMDPTDASLFDMLSGRIGAGSWLPHPAGFPLVTLCPGQASGRLTGGNLAMIGSTLGTPYEIDTRDSILLIEDVGEPLYKIDRLLTQLRLAGKYRQLRGVLVGDFDALSLQELSPLLLQEFGPLGIPVLAGWRSGHADPNLTLPHGARMTLDASGQRLRLDQAVVSGRR